MVFFRNIPPGLHAKTVLVSFVKDVLVGIRVEVPSHKVCATLLLCPVPNLGAASGVDTCPSPGHPLHSACTPPCLQGLPTANEACNICNISHSTCSQLPPAPVFCTYCKGQPRSWRYAAFPTRPSLSPLSFTRFSPSLLSCSCPERCQDLRPSPAASWATSAFLWPCSLLCPGAARERGWAVCDITGHLHGEGAGAVDLWSKEREGQEPKCLCHLQEPGPGAGLSGTSLSIAGDSLADIFWLPCGAGRGRGRSQGAAPRSITGCLIPSAPQRGAWSSTGTSRHCLTDGSSFGLHLGKR